MHDVVIIGGGHAGDALVRAFSGAKLNVATVEECCPKPEWWNTDWIEGRGAVAAKGLVVVLDPDTGDERRLLPCKAIVIAIGRMDPNSYTRHQLGITKLGAEFTPDNSQVVTDEKGRTRAPGIFASGSCASSSTPGIILEVINYCKAATPAVEAKARA